MAETTEALVGTVRSFNRFYTKVIGVLQEGLLASPYSLTECRVLFELGQRLDVEVSDLRAELGIDAGYLSRLLARFEADALITRDRSSLDGRRQVIALTAAGRRVFETLDRRSADEVRTLLHGHGDEDQRRLTAAMATIRDVLDGAGPAKSFVIRPPRPGDYGWVVHRNGAVYADEYGWDESYEALVARIVADYLAEHDPDREAGWIADVDGEPVGSVFCMKRDESTAQLRLLVVDPRARGMGIGGRLVDECLRFARGAGYRQMMLWTMDRLVDARRIYERSGFELTEQTPVRMFGHDLVNQIWSRPL